MFVCSPAKSCELTAAAAALGGGGDVAGAAEVKLRRRSAKDEPVGEPTSELMKVFARRSLKVRDSFIFDAPTDLGPAPIDPGPAPCGPAPAAVEEPIR